MHGTMVEFRANGGAAGSTAANLYHGERAITPDDAQRLLMALEMPHTAGVRAETYVDDAGHAFFNDTGAVVYKPDAAHLAWDRTIEFLPQSLV